MNSPLRLLIAIVLLSAPSPVSAYTFTNVADITAAAPAGVFSSFYTPSISGATVAFNADYGSGPQSAIFTGSGGPLTTITRSGNAAPVGVFEPDFSDPAISGVAAAFYGYFNGHNDHGIFMGSGGPLTTIAKTGSAAPIGTFTSLYGPAISGTTVAFQAEYGVEQYGTFRSNGGPLTTIAKVGDPAPIGSISGFGLFSSAGISGNNVAFVAAYDDNNRYGVFRGDGGPLTTIAKFGDPAPSGTFTDFVGTAISGNAVAFAAYFAGDSMRGIFMGSGGALTTIAKIGDPAPVGTFSGGDIPAISNGIVAFRGDYDHDNQHGIFVGTGGPLATVVKTGDSLFGSTVTNLDFAERGLDTHGSGNLTFGYQLADGRAGIALAMPSGADFNGDGRVNTADLASWKGGFGALGTATHMQGDVDSDLDVDGTDFLLWQRELGASTEFPYSGADGDVSGAIDAADLAVWRDHFGMGPAATSVPEPATIGLIVVGAPVTIVSKKNRRVVRRAGIAGNKPGIHVALIALLRKQGRHGNAV